MYKETITKNLVGDGDIHSFRFGKNGKGLSEELIAIGERINELSKTQRIYLRETFVDELDDVYEFKFVVMPEW